MASCITRSGMRITANKMIPKLNIQIADNGEVYAGLATGALLAAVVFFVLWPALEPADAPIRVVADRVSQSPGNRPGAAPQRRPAAAAETAPVGPVALTLDPQDVIGNLDCRMSAGRGPASDTALVVLPVETAEGTPKRSRFAVLDANGQVFGGVLPFRPNHWRLGKNVNGVVVAGFADLRLNSGAFRDPGTAEPVHIYADGQLIFASERALDFGVAPDGSSFFLQEPSAGEREGPAPRREEPLPGDVTRLVVYDLELGTEEHIELDDRFSPADGFFTGYRAAYADGGKEIVFSTASEDEFGAGTHRFFPVRGGPPREIQVGEETDSAGAATIRLEDATSTRLRSSREGYFALPTQRGLRRGGTGVWRIVRRAFDHESEKEPSAGAARERAAREGPAPRMEEPSAGAARERAAREGLAPRMGEPVTEVWSRNVHLNSFHGMMSVSRNGAWLTLHAWNFQVLDAATGETLFAYPRVGDKESELERLAGVMPPGATVADLGQVDGSTFRGDRLLLFRKIGSSLGCGGPGRRKCLADLRRKGVYNRVVDVFDMNTIALDSQPDFRVEVGPDIPCGAGDFPLRGLQVHDGELTFLTTRR